MATKGTRAKDAIAVLKQDHRAIESLFEDVYAEMTPQIKEQMDAYLASGERRRPEMMDRFPL